jgi:MoaA/NifB/PqqE/SkfB family radical SAM enzyme
MYQIGSIVEVHLEITSKCSARCPQCPRNSDIGVTNPELPEVELTLEDVKCIFCPSFLGQLRCVAICGNYGDPAVARDTLPVVQYFRSANSALVIQINSHGSVRPAAWWKELGRLGITCHFSIDGLEDTNHIYRRGTRWSTIIRNARTFISAGGRAIWDYLIFAHNEHQVDEARALSVEFGFERFVPKKTARFLRDGKMVSEMPVFDKNGALSLNLSLPKSARYQNDVLRRMNEEIKSRSAYEYYIENTPITCKAASKGGIYVSAEGLVFPCCYLAHVYPARHNPAASQMADVLNRLPGGKSSISALLHPLEEIVSGPFFQTTVPDGWRAGANVRMRTCSQQCGGYDLLSAQRS